MKADLNLIDLEAIALQRPYFVHDLPAGGTRLMQRAGGFTATIVSGRVTYRGGEQTSALPGRLIRGPQSRSEEHTSELQSLMRNSYAVFCLKQKKKQKH